MVAPSAIRGAVIVGHQGGWGVMLEVGTTEKPLGTQRTDKPRIWASLDTCMAYLRDKVGASRAALEEGTDQMIPAKEWAAKRAKKAK
jgi:hypothetical protein